MDRKLWSFSYPHRIMFGGNMCSGSKDRVKNSLKVYRKKQKKRKIVIKKAFLNFQLR